MAKFKKRSVVIDAVRFKDFLLSNVQPLPTWLVTALCAGDVYQAPGPEPIWRVKTIDGVDFPVTEDDWLIRGVKGELYPCKDDVFQQTYEPVEEEEWSQSISQPEYKGRLPF